MIPLAFSGPFLFWLSAERERYQAEPEKKRTTERERYQAEPEKKQTAERERYQEDPEKKRSAKRLRYWESPESACLVCTRSAHAAVSKVSADAVLKMALNVRRKKQGNF